MRGPRVVIPNFAVEIPNFAVEIPNFAVVPETPKNLQIPKKNHSDKKADVPNRQIKLFGRFVQCRTILVRWFWDLPVPASL